MTMLFGLTACEGIGEGSTIRSMEIVPAPIAALDHGAIVDDGLPTERFRMFDCFCSNLGSIATFTDGARANFNFRARWTSSDPSVVEVTNFGDGTTDLCPLSQQVPGLLIPKGVGTATITADFVGIKGSFTVEVADTAAAADDGSGGSTFTLEPVDADNTGQLAAGSDLALRADAVLDGRPRNLNGNVTAWDFVTANDDVATINSIGIVRGFGADEGTPAVARAAFASCDVQLTKSLRVGEIVAPMTIAEEPGFDVDDDDRLAVNTNELLKVTTGLDFGDGSDAGTQDVSGQIRLGWTDACTLRSYEPGGDGSSSLTDCKEVATTCAQDVPVCSTGATSCASTHTDCRLVATPMANVINVNRVVAVTDADAPTTFTARFPGAVGTATTLAADALSTDTTITVTALSGYPLSPPWDAIITDAGDPAVQEIVRVTGVDEQTLTVRRGIGGTTARAHAAGDAFAPRTFGSGSVQVQADGRTLAALALETPSSTTLEAFGTLQLQAIGTFEDTDDTDPFEGARRQRVTRLQAFASGSPATVWSSSDTSVATVGGTGTVNSVDPCGGTVVIRARASTSATTESAAFELTTEATEDADGNGNDDANDTACLGTDPLCDQVTLTMPQQDPWLGATAPETACAED